MERLGPLATICSGFGTLNRAQHAVRKDYTAMKMIRTRPRPWAAVVLEGSAFRALFGVPLRTWSAHVVMLWPVGVAGPFDQTLPPRHEPIEAAEQWQEGGCRGNHDETQCALPRMEEKGTSKISSS